MPALNNQLSSVMQRRGELLARIAAQREQVAGIGERLQAPLKWVDRGVTVAHFLRANPVFVAGAVAILAMRRRSVAGILRAVLRVWRGYRSISAIASNIPR